LPAGQDTLRGAGLPPESPAYSPESDSIGPKGRTYGGIRMVTSFLPLIYDYSGSFDVISPVPYDLPAHRPPCDGQMPVSNLRPLPKEFMQEPPAALPAIVFFRFFRIFPLISAATYDTVCEQWLLGGRFLRIFEPVSQKGGDVGNGVPTPVFLVFLHFFLELCKIL